MKLNKINIFLLSLLSFILFSACGNKETVSVNIIDNKQIEITNLRKKDVSNLEVRTLYPSGANSKFYSYDIEKLSGGQKLVIEKKDLKTHEGLSFPEDVKLKSLTFSTDKKGIIQLWNYTPILKDPTGYLFATNDADNFSIQFYKYSNQGTFKVRGLNSDWLKDGKFHLTEDGSVILECAYTDVFDFSSKPINLEWKGTFEDDEFNLKLTSARPQGMSYLFSTNYTLYLEKSLDTNVKNPQSDEKFSDYESSILFALAQNFKSDEAITEYEKIFYNDDYQKSKNDEFAIHALQEKCNTEFKNKLANLNNEYSVRFMWNLGDYDFNKESFKISFYTDQSINPIAVPIPFIFNDVESNSSLNLAYLESKYPSITQSVIIGTKGFAGFYRAIEANILMSKDKAQEFLNARKSVDGKTDKSVLCIAYYRVPKTSQKDALYDSFLGRAKNSVSGNLYKLEIYDNENDMNKLYQGSIK